MAVYRECMVCGKRFKVCDTCMRSMPEVLQWRRVCCCLSHFSYHLPIIRYIRGEINKDKAKADLRLAIDKYGEIEFAKGVADVVDEILAD